MKNIFKTFICVVLGVLLMLTAVACNNNQGGENPLPGNYSRPSNPNINNEFTATSNTLVAYFSKTNTTKGVAETIQELTDADIFEIERKEPYPNSYTPTTEVAKEEKDNNARPELATYLPDEVIAQYDTIILGFPIWWHTAPMAVLSFLNYYDLSGKTIYTFATSGGSPISESTADIRSNTQATVNEGRLFNGSNETTIRNWLDGLGLIFSPEQPELPENPVNPPVNPDDNTPTIPDDEQPNDPTAFNPPQDNRPGAENTNVLVVYFSMPETTNPDNMTTEEANSTVIIDGVVLGNTQYMAYVIQDNSGADIFRIIPKIPYPTDHRTLVDQASAEKAQGARPEIKDTIINLDKYDTVFVGYPNWWGDMPMIMYTFFDTYDFSGKTIIPFNTHGGSGFSSTISTIRRLEPNATVKDGLSISRNNIQDAEQQIVTWVNGLGFYKPSETPSEPLGSKILIVYFTAERGNTENLANYIHSQIGGDIVKIEAAQPYTSQDLNYSIPNNRPEVEKAENARPEIAQSTYDQIDISEYDTVFIGYPIWWWTAPMIVGTFLEHYDLTGYNIYPFSQSASMNTTQFDTSMEFVRECAAEANVHEGLFARASSTTTINAYLTANGFIG
ncbi:MAG: flavodoxin [Clostridia bacterium]|nr:flavodoxin [Clostridia bacterium]